jgi:hypothetical protein
MHAGFFIFQNYITMTLIVINLSDGIGFAGVAILLLAYLLNLSGKLKQSDLPYILLNIIGAGLACLASAIIYYIPFVILEGAWTLVSLIALLKYFNSSN